MCNINFLLEENARLRKENHDLQNMNNALSHIVQHTMSVVGSIRVPRQFGKIYGKIEFRSAPGNSVDIVLVRPEEYISQTGDPILDYIFMK